MATAAPIAGSPAFTATGTIIAPIKATAGDGQKNQDITIIVRPVTQKAKTSFFINLVNGFIITSLTPVTVKSLLRETITEIIKMVGSNSVIAYIKLLNTPIVESERDFVLTKASINIPTIHINEQSLLRIIIPKINKIRIK